MGNLQGTNVFALMARITEHRRMCTGPSSSASTTMKVGHEYEKWSQCKTKRPKRFAVIETTFCAWRAVAKLTFGKSSLLF